ncbi:MAG: glutaredoxin family protein, partial [Rickettsia endosymbiont of Ixodes persulcatus]|nr:glutaredoxin family protein [Rickettsia endosymbiont of Ixodes persulcatus]
MAFWWRKFLFFGLLRKGCFKLSLNIKFHGRKMIFLLVLANLSLQTTLAEFTSMLQERNSIILVTKSCCPSCMGAKRDLTSKGIKYTEVDATTSPEVIWYIKSQYNYHIVPAIFYFGEFGYGYNELEGELKRIESMLVPKTSECGGTINPITENTRIYNYSSGNAPVYNYDSCKFSTDNNNNQNNYKPINIKPVFCYYPTSYQGNVNGTSSPSTCNNNLNDYSTLGIPPLVYYKKTNGQENNT